MEILWSSFNNCITLMDSIGVCDVGNAKKYPMEYVVTLSQKCILPNLIVNLLPGPTLYL